MTRSLVAYKIHSRNSFIHKGIIIKRLGANTILLGNPNPDINMKIFVSYAMVYTVAKKILNRRITPSIASRGSNEDGGHFFMSIYNG